MPAIENTPRASQMLLTRLRRNSCPSKTTLSVSRTLLSFLSNPRVRVIVANIKSNRDKGRGKCSATFNRSVTAESDKKKKKEVRFVDDDQTIVQGNRRRTTATGGTVLFHGSIKKQRKRHRNHRQFLRVIRKNQLLRLCSLRD